MRELMGNGRWKHSDRIAEDEAAMRPEIERCRTEIAAIEVLLRAGHPDVQGLCVALMDWHAELRLLRRDFEDDCSQEAA